MLSLWYRSLNWTPPPPSLSTSSSMRTSAASSNPDNWQKVSASRPLANWLVHLDSTVPPSQPPTNSWSPKASSPAKSDAAASSPCNILQPPATRSTGPTSSNARPPAHNPQPPTPYRAKASASPPPVPPSNYSRWTPFARAAKRSWLVPISPTSCNSAPPADTNRSAATFSTPPAPKTWPPRTTT